MVIFVEFCAEENAMDRVECQVTDENEHREGEAASNSTADELSIFRFVFHSENRCEPIGCGCDDACQPFPEQKDSFFPCLFLNVG